MSYYPEGSDTMWAPWNEEQSETVQDVYCGECDLTCPDMEVTWSNQSHYGYVNCPFCGGEIEVDPPEPDWDSIAERKADARADRYGY